MRARSNNKDSKPKKGSERGARFVCHAIPPRHEGQGFSRKMMSDLHPSSHQTAVMPEKSAITPLRETWQQLLQSARGRAPQLRASLIGLAGAAATQGLGLACLPPLFIALLETHDMNSAIGWLATLSIFMLASALLRWQAQGFDFRGDMVANTHELRSQLGEQLRRMPLEILQNKRAGEINATLLGNVDENLGYVLTVANLMATALITPIVTAIAILPIDWRMGMTLLLIFPLLIPFYRWRRPTFGQSMRQMAVAHEQTSSDIVEYTQGLAVLRAACCEGAKFQRLRDSLSHLETLQATGQRKSSQPTLIFTSVMELSVLLAMCAGITLVTMGSLSPAVLASLVVIVARFAEPLATFVIYTKVIDLIEVALRNIQALLAVQPLPQQTPQQKPSRFDVHFADVDFYYRGTTEPALHAFSAHLPARSLTALVGPSGSGKTTITRLLMRHADPQSGHITIGGADIRTMTPEQLNALISVVFQDVYLFDDSILANIRMAKPDATDEEVKAAAHAAHCHDFITRLPDGYQTGVGDIGGRLSGGERQRISIARAILKNAPIIILDEPTAALDTESEVAVQRAIDTLVQDKTVIVIAHRLSTVAGAQHILVVENGHISEQGTHQDLIASNGRYWAMWQAQQTNKKWHPNAILDSTSHINS